MQIFAICTRLHNNYICFYYYLECLKGSYKSTDSNTKCLQCPANSKSNTERTGCRCNSGLYKLTTEHEAAPCKGICNTKCLVTGK